MVFPAHVCLARRRAKVFVRGKLFPPLTLSPLSLSLSLPLSVCDVPGRLFFRPLWTTVCLSDWSEVASGHTRAQ